MHRGSMGIWWGRLKGFTGFDCLLFDAPFPPLVIPAQAGIQPKVPRKRFFVATGTDDSRMRECLRRDDQGGAEID